MMGGAATSWFCKKQPVVSISSTEAEYYALSEAIKEVLWVRQVLNEIGLSLNRPTTVYQDNRSTIAIALNPIQHQRVKHMDVRVHFLRDHLDKKDAELVWCPTDDMVADIFTKALPGPAHAKFTELLGLRSLAFLRGEGSPCKLEYTF
jgi:KUP system potassium uptake protein